MTLADRDLREHPDAHRIPAIDARAVPRPEALAGRVKWGDMTAAALLSVGFLLLIVAIALAFALLLLSNAEVCEAPC